MCIIMTFDLIIFFIKQTISDMKFHISILVLMHIIKQIRINVLKTLNSMLNIIFHTHYLTFSL
jgi:hypothetical protein